MEKEYTTCWNWMMPKCPNMDKKCMINLLPSSQQPDKYFTGEDIEMANKLCQNCVEFSPKKEG